MVKPLLALVLTLIATDYPEGMTQRNSPSNHSKGLFFWVWSCLVLSGGLLATPKLSQDSNTAQWVSWMEKAIGEDQKSEKALQTLEGAITHLSNLAGEKALANPRHFGELQMLKEGRRELLFQAMNQALEKNPRELTSWKKRMAHAPAEDQLPLLEKMADWSGYLKALRQVLETSERAPKELRRELRLPPRIEGIPQWTSRDLQNAMAVLELCFKRHWSPSPELMEGAILAMLDRMEAIGKPNWSGDLIEMLPRQLQTSTVKERMSRLGGIASPQVEELDAGDLY